MKWLQQQQKVEILAEKAEENSRNIQRLQKRLIIRVRRTLQQPGTLAWSFAAGTLLGASHGSEKNHNAFDLLRYVNTATVVLSYLSSHQDVSEST